MTAEDILKKYPDYWQGGKAQYSEEDVKKAMIEFAKLHVEQALKAASENVIVHDDAFKEAEVDKDSILNAYPLTNIK
jgi:D-aminopeptidase